MSKGTGWHYGLHSSASSSVHSTSVTELELLKKIKVQRYKRKLQRFLVPPFTPPQRITANLQILECSKGFKFNLKSKICDPSDHIVSMNLDISCDIATETVRKEKNV